MVRAINATSTNISKNSLLTAKSKVAKKAKSMSLPSKLINNLALNAEIQKNTIMDPMLHKNFFRMGCDDFDCDDVYTEARRL